MARYLLNLLLLLHCQMASASISDSIVGYFKDEAGRTNWQYVANTASSLLIIALSLVALRLFWVGRRARRYNRQLEEIRAQLEQRVAERTATLDHANRMLQDTNKALGAEITEHRETTNRLRSSEAYINSILHSMPLMVVGLNKDNLVTQWNRRAEEISGVKARDALGKDLWTAHPGTTVLPGQLNRARQKGETITVKHSQRGQYHFDITLYPLNTDSETGVVILIDDVTQRINAENMLIQRDKMASMGELAASMAHELDVPLEAMLDSADDCLNSLRQHNPIDHATRDSLIERLSESQRHGEQAAAVIENLLEFSRTRGGEKQLVDAAELLDHSLELARKVIAVPSGLRFSDIHIERQFARDLPPLPCFAAELQQVFISLFRQACHAMGEIDDAGFRPLLKISLSEFFDTLWIKIEHNGRALSPEEQQNIFEPFFVNQSSDSDYDAGKRLSFSYFIVTEQHRGELAVTSDPDAGTIFHIQLQLK